MNSPEFDKQWGIMKDVILQSGIDMYVLNKLISGLMQVNNSSGYGSIYIAMVGGLLQDFKITLGERIEMKIIKEMKNSSFDN